MVCRNLVNGQIGNGHLINLGHNNTIQYLLQHPAITVREYHIEQEIEAKRTEEKERCHQPKIK